MEEFRRSYSRLCKESGAEPQESVLQRLHELPPGRLDLATQSLTVDTCRALGKLLQNEALLTELVLSDCMLSEEGGHRGLVGGRPAPASSGGVGVKPVDVASPCSVRPAAPLLPSGRSSDLSGQLRSTFLGGSSSCTLLTASDGVSLKPRSRGQFLFVTEKP